MNKGGKAFLILDHTAEQHCKSKKKKVKQSRYTPWRRLGGEEV
jgi:hypothetical protein